MAYIKQEDILEKTSGGLDIITSFYPQAKQALATSEKRFRIRDEKTPSAAIKQLQDGNYVVTDFGDDQTPRNGIQICMKEESVTFREALVLLADRFNVGGIKSEINKPIISNRPATAEEIEGSYSYEVKKEFSQEDLEIIGPIVAKRNKERKTLEKYHVNALKSFTYIKNRTAYITESTENYPIFLFNDSNKIYMPLNPEKGYRFRYVGKKEKDFVNGLSQLQAAYDVYKKQQLNEEVDDDKDSIVKKLPEAILCSGERDSLNIAAQGYYPLWLNSETAKLTGENMKAIMKCVDNLYNLPDIDNTGIKAAIRLGMTYLDIKIMILPAELKTYKDNRGKPRKDYLDYVELHPTKRDTQKLIDVAKPMRFWNISISKEGVKRYKFNSAHALFFLWANGFCKLEDKNSKEGSIIVRRDGNVVSEINPKDVKSYFLNFIEKRYLSVDIENMIHETPALSDDRLRGLKSADIDFTDFNQHSQYLFFENGSIKVDSTGVYQFKKGEINKYTWEEKVIPHKFKKLDPFFNIQKDQDNNLYDIEIFKHDSHYFNYLVNASRIHWQMELEERLESLSAEDKIVYLKENKFSINGALLTAEEIAEQKQHLVNKIFSIGYMLHQYKNKARPWAIFAVDGKLAGNNESCGGSGKSFCYGSLGIFKKTVTLPGRNPRIVENPHIYDRVNEYTDMVLVDDADKYLPFNFFYDTISGVMSVNPKMNKSYEIPFSNSPKFCFTSNYMLQNPDPSTLRRILYTVFSDYYHEKTEYSSYKETRKIADDFGKQLFDDYNEEEWNNDLNFFAQCLQFYLSVPSPQKINPPMGTVIQRNLLAEMGEAFKDWAEVYFAPDGDNVDKTVARENALKDFVANTNSNKWTTNKFTKALKAFCRYYDYTYNPEELRNSQGRITKKVDGKATDMVFIQTKNINPVELTEGYEIDEKNKPF